MLPKYLAMGVTKKEFFHSSPKVLSAYAEGYKIQRKVQDENMWIMGQYMVSAVSVAIDHCLNGRKASSKYVEKPFMQDIENNGEHVYTEEELQQQREMFVALLMAKKSNYELHHKEQ